MISLLFSTYITLPELFSISGVARPDANVTPNSVEPYAVSTLPDAVEISPLIALEPFDSNALTTP